MVLSVNWQQISHQNFLAEKNRHFIIGPYMYLGPQLGRDNERSRHIFSHSYLLKIMKQKLAIVNPKTSLT